MARNCSICSDPRISEIDAALLGTEAYRSIAKQFLLSESAVYRHQKEHLPVTLGRQLNDAGQTPGALLGIGERSPSGDQEGADGQDVAVIKKGVASGELVNHLGSLHTNTLTILKDSMQANRHETGLKAVREARQNVELAAKLTGALDIPHESAFEISVAHFAASDDSPTVTAVKISATRR